MSEVQQFIGSVMNFVECADGDSILVSCYLNCTNGGLHFMFSLKTLAILQPWSLCRLFQATLLQHWSSHWGLFKYCQTHKRIPKGCEKVNVSILLLKWVTVEKNKTNKKQATKKVITVCGSKVIELLINSVTFSEICDCIFLDSWKDGYWLYLAPF